jgi:hypothetical protein
VHFGGAFSRLAGRISASLSLAEALKDLLEAARQKGTLSPAFFKGYSGTERNMTNPAVGFMVVSLVLLLGNAVGAQRAPQFAGIWHPFNLTILDTSQDITIRQDAATIAIVEPGNQKTTNVYKLDGSESWNGDRVSRATWVGDRLVIESSTDQIRTRVVLNLNVWSTVLAVWHEDSSVTQPTVYKKRLSSPSL